MCCVSGTRKHSWDDLAKIGEEGPPWYCGEHDVYVAFEIADQRQQERTGWQADDLDTLKSISIYHWLENCL